MSLFEVVKEPEDLTAPALVVSFEDWVDAGAAGTTAARHIAGEGEAVATFAADDLYDYRSHRPVLDIVDGVPSRFVWPALQLTRRRLRERDVLVLTGPEPDYRWREFAGDVHELAVRFGVVEHVSLGAIPAAVPHTAPTPVMMTASGEELLRGGRPTEGLLRVPAAAVSVVEWTMAQHGIPAVGFWAQIPHYATPYAAGAIALVRRIEDHLSVTVGAGELEQQVVAQRTALEQIFASNPEAKEHLERLEGLVGEADVPAAENIAEEVEKFLRNQRRGDGGPTPYSP
ncbi:MAG TPA: PAC2 family protein [Actinomycetota bacterium]|nr:PAC2 family protein [Actinomycetota bacterium]